MSDYFLFVTQGTQMCFAITQNTVGLSLSLSLCVVEVSGSFNPF